MNFVEHSETGANQPRNTAEWGSRPIQQRQIIPYKPLFNKVPYMFLGVEGVPPKTKQF